jgi:hypothetical protein
MIRRELIKRNLINLSLPFEDTVKNSPNFINVTAKTNLLKAGKNIFTFKPNYNYLSERFPIVFEVLDVAGKPLFYESTQLLDNDGSNIISIHVYDNTPSGNASIIFVATTKYDLGLTELSQQQIVENNFRYVHQIEINQFERNDTKIIISTDPTFTAKEISAYVLEEKFDDKKVERKYGTGSFLSTPSSISFFDNPPQFTQDMIGGKIYFTKISENYSPTSSFDIQENPYSSYILDVNSPSHITLESPLIVSASSGVYSNVSTTISQIERQEYYIEYNKLSDNRVYTQNLKPYAKVEIDNLNTFSGKISKVKVYSKSSAKPDSEYSLVYDDDVYPKNILVDKSGSLIEYPIGIFNNNIVINNAGSNTTSSYFALDYWNVNGINGAPSAQKNTSSLYLPDGVYLTPSAFMSSSQELFFEQTSSVASKFYPNTEYELSFNYHLAESVNDNREQKIEVYMSGSAFVSDTIYGKFIVTVPPANIGRSLVKNYRVPILPNFEGNGVLKFLMRDNASISNVKIQEDVDTGFSPNRLTLYVPIKNDHKNEYLDFKFEFFDHTYNVADKTFYVKSIFFNGSNSYIVGDDNIITGSTFVSSFTSSGIELYSKMKPSASMLTSGSSISSYGYQGVEYVNLYPTTNSNFGWSLTTGNPFVSSSYSDTTVQMINKSGSKFDFRTNPDSFDLSIVGNNSNVLIGVSGSANDSYLKWDSNNLQIQSNSITGSISGSINGYSGSLNSLNGFDEKLNSVTSSLNNLTGSFNRLSSSFNRITGSSDVAIYVSGSNTVGGSQYIDFLRVSNSTTPVANPNKTFRLDNEGTLQIIDSTYLNNVWSLTDTGIVKIPSAAGKTIGFKATGSAISFNSDGGQIFDDGNFHIHSLNPGANLWLNASGSGKLVINAQTGATGGVLIGTETQSGYVTINGSVNASYTYAYLTPAVAAPYTGTSFGTNPYSLTANSRIQASEFNATSDERLKNILGNIKLADAIKFIKGVNAIQFTWKDELDRGVKTGYSAQQLIKTGFEHLVGAVPKPGLEETVDSDGFISPKDTQLVVNNDQITPYHTLLIQNLLERIEILEKRLLDSNN